MPRQSQPVRAHLSARGGRRGDRLGGGRIDAASWYVAWPALKTIIGNKLFPSLGDRMAARQAWDGQMTRGSWKSGSSAANLFVPAVAKVSKEATGVSLTRGRTRTAPRSGFRGTALG